MDPNDATITILHEIRDQTRGIRADIGGIRSDMQQLRGDMVARFEQSDLRFAAIEAALKELVEQTRSLRLRVLEFPDQH